MNPSAPMNLPADTDPRFRHLTLKLGLFVGLGLVLGLALLIGLAVRQGYFAAKTPVWFVADSGSELRPGMAVKLSGFKIGEVRSVALDPMARVDVEMQIEDRYLQWVKADSVATLSREGLIGDSFISLSRGNPSLPPLVHEDRLRFVAGSSLSDIAMDVRNRVVPVIDDLHAFLAYVNDPRGDVRGSFADLRRLAKGLEGTRRQLDTSLQQIDRLSGTEAPATLAQARATLTRAEASLAELEKAIPALSAQAGRSLDSLDQATANAAHAAQRAEKLLDETAPRLDATLQETQALVRDSRAAVEAARTRWPFKGPDVAPASAATK